MNSDFGFQWVQVSQHSTGYSSKKPQTAGNDWLNRLPLSFISPLIFCLHSSPSCQRSLFRFYGRQYSSIPPSQLTSEKIIGDRFAGRTFHQPQSRALSGKWLRLTACFTLNGSKENILVPMKVCKFTVYSTHSDTRGVQVHLRVESNKQQRVFFFSFFSALFSKFTGVLWCILGKWLICFLVES